MRLFLRALVTHTHSHRCSSTSNLETGPYDDPVEPRLSWLFSRFATLVPAEAARERVSESQHRGPGNVVRGHPPKTRPALLVQDGAAENGRRQ